jgi:hypothetical protein
MHEPQNGADLAQYVGAVNWMRSAILKDIQAAIMESMTLAFPDQDKRICVLTDASDRFYTGLVTQIDEEQLDLSTEEQDHQPLAFLPGEFKGAQLR